MKMKNKKNYIYFIILIIFITLSLFIGYHHEPWADEAQAWLVARDTTLQSLFFKYLHSEGHPALWYIILKCFIYLGLPYKYIYIIPIIFSTIGVSIFLFKSKFPLFIKILFPFTYFIFYQYNIIARSYCLLLPIIALLASIWDKRHTKCFLFTLTLILLMSTTAYTYVLAGIIYLSYIYEFKNNQDITNKKEHIISIFILTIFFIITLLYVYPIPSNTFNPTGLPYFISDSLFTTIKTNKIIKIILSIIIYIYIVLSYKKTNKPNNLIQLILFTFPIISFFILKYYNLWHLGIILLILIFCFWIHKMENNKSIIILLLFTFSIQIYYSISASFYDYKNIYSPAKEVATFLKKYKTKKIYGLTFNENAINPYFSKNIFINWDNGAFFYWNTKNKFYENIISEQEMLNKKLDIVVVSSFYRKLNDEILKEKYNIYEFNGYSYFENFKYENQTIKVYILKTIDKKDK